MRCALCNDAFTTNNVKEAGGDYIDEETDFTNVKYAKVVNGVATLQTTADDDTCFLAVPTTMPDGTVGVELTYIGYLVVGAAASLVEGAEIEIDASSTAAAGSTPVTGKIVVG